MCTIRAIAIADVYYLMPLPCRVPTQSLSLGFNAVNALYPKAKGHVDRAGAVLGQTCIFNADCAVVGDVWCSNLLSCCGTDGTECAKLSDCCGARSCINGACTAGSRFPALLSTS